MGAKVVERHITMDKTWKGSDHEASLGKMLKLSGVSHSGVSSSGGVSHSGVS